MHGGLWFILFPLFCVSKVAFVDSEDVGRFSVTLVYQASIDRLWMMEELCQRWQGHIALAIFVPFDSNGNHSISNGMESLQSCGDRLRYKVHRAASEKELTDYPVNILRNVALELAETSHVLTADIDFSPSANLYDEIKSHAGLLLPNPKLALVVPAFQKHGSSCSSIEKCKVLASKPGFLPGDILSLEQCLTAKECIVFQADNNKAGHATTKSAEWLRLSPMWPDPQPLTCIGSSRYEPYLVLARENSPRYDERFFGYGKNKIQYIHHLRFAGFHFAILPREFLIHMPHPKSTAKLNWLHDRAAHSKVDAQFLHFMNDLAKEHTKKPATPICRGIRH